MKATVRTFFSPDIEFSSFQPNELDNFSFLLEAIIGPNDSPGEESIQFLICTPKSLESRLASVGGVLFGHSLVIVESADISKILDAVTARIERVEGASWSQVANRLSRLGAYEFED